jgi:hypothetical protein
MNSCSVSVLTKFVGKCRLFTLVCVICIHSYIGANAVHGRGINLVVINGMTIYFESNLETPVWLIVTSSGYYCKLVHNVELYIPYFQSWLAVLLLLFEHYLI